MDQNLMTLQSRLDEKNYITLIAADESLYVDKIINGEAKRLFTTASKSDLEHISTKYFWTEQGYAEATVAPGAYVVFAFTFAYNNPQLIKIAVVSGTDFNDGTEHKTINVIHDQSSIAIEVSISTNNTRQMKIKASRENTTHFGIVLARLKYN